MLPGRNLVLLRHLELVELRQGASEPDLPTGGVHQVEGHESAEALPVLRLDHEVGDLPADGVDHDAGHLATAAVGATGLGPDDVLHFLCHATASVMPNVAASANPAAVVPDPTGRTSVPEAGHGR